jgi:Uma2 family endonuclease
MVAPERTITVKQFWQEYAGKPYELIDGQIVEVALSGGTKGIITTRIGNLISAFVFSYDLGEVFLKTGFQLGKDLRGADAAFVTTERWQTVTEPEKYVPFAPDLAVEVVSPNDSASDVNNKVDLYFVSGSQLVWVIYPKSRQIIAHYPDHTARIFNDTELIDGADVLPGLQIAVTKIFPPRTG